MNRLCSMILTMDLNKSSKQWNLSFIEKRAKKKLMPWKWLCSVKVHKASLYVTKVNQKEYHNSRIRQIHSRKRNSVSMPKVQTQYSQSKDISNNELEVFLYLHHNKFRNPSSKRKNINQPIIREITLCKID